MQKRFEGGVKFTWTTAIFRISSLFIFFFLLLLDKRWCNWETLVSFSISPLCLFFSLHIFVRRNSSLWDFILVWNFKNFSSAFRSSLFFFGKTIFLSCAWIQKENWEGWRTDMKRVLSENWNKYLITFWKVFIFWCGMAAKVLMYMSISFKIGNGNERMVKATFYIKFIRVPTHCQKNNISTFFKNWQIQSI